MKIVIDTNILLSALIKDSTTRKIIVESGLDFYYPELSFHEVRKYKNLVLDKSKMTGKEYTKLLNLLLDKISLVSEEQTLDNLKEAKVLLAEVDPDDVVFLATALCLKNSAIWSDDVHFERQNRVKIFKTKSMTKFI